MGISTRLFCRAFMQTGPDVQLESLPKIPVPVHPKSDR